METRVISDKMQEFNGERFYLCGNYFQHRGKRLHRTVWQYHNGEIPKDTTFTTKMGIGTITA